MEFLYKKVHFVGIKGAGMTSLATILKAHNVEVTGSDTQEVFFTDILLHNANIVVSTPFSEKNISDTVEAVVYSTAYKEETNSEIVLAKRKGIPLYSYPEFLGILTKQKKSIAVCGTHGKTTTSALLGHVLNYAEMHPSALVGGEVLNWKSGALSGTGSYFVFESDEYQNKFSYYAPWSILLTNVTWDHPDFFPDKNAYEKVFTDYIHKVPSDGWVIVNADDPGALRVSESKSFQRITYGYGEHAQYRIYDTTTQNGFIQSFSVRTNEKNLGIFSLSLFGKHNIQNATAVIALCDTLGIPMNAISRGLESFLGTTRRLEKKGVYHNTTYIYDDYAHHPEEIEASLLALKGVYPNKKLIVVFQPHTFSRTQTFLDLFVQSLNKADTIVLLDIYASAREHRGTISSDDIAKKITSAYPNKRAFNIHTIQNAVEYLYKEDLIDDSSVLVTMGAGDVWRVGEELLAKNQEK